MKDFFQIATPPEKAIILTTYPTLSDREENNTVCTCEVVNAWWKEFANCSTGKGWLEYRVCVD